MRFASQRHPFHGMQALPGAFALLFLSSVASFAGGSPPTGHHITTPAAPALAAMCFIENRGQLVNTDKQPVPDVLYYTSTGNVRLFFTKHGISQVFIQCESAPATIKESDGRAVFPHPTPADLVTCARPRRVETSPMQLARFDMTWDGANEDVVVEADAKTGHENNFYLAHCPAGIVHVQEYMHLAYRNLYDNIDLDVTTDGRRVKFTYTVYPGGDASRIAISYPEGADVTVENGRLRVVHPFGMSEETVPYAFQDAHMRRTSCPVDFNHSGTRVGFDITNFDRSRPVIIDPWTTYWGGDIPYDTTLGRYDVITGIAASPYGTFNITGTTTIIDYPVLPGAFQSIYAGGLNDVFITSVGIEGRPRWSTYYGGSRSDGPYGIACIKENGTVAVAGMTSSDNFPLSSGAFRTAKMILGSDVGFLVVIDSTGTRLAATLVAGTSNEHVSSVLPLPEKQLCVLGVTSSNQFPTSVGAYKTSFVRSSIFLIMFDSVGRYVRSTFVCDSSSIEISERCCVDSTGDIVLQGSTLSTLTLSTPGAQWPSRPNLGPKIFANFIAKFNRFGSRVWLTYFPGTFYRTTRIANDAIVFAGQWDTTAFPHTQRLASISGNSPAYLMMGSLSSQGRIRWSENYPFGLNMLTADARGNFYTVGQDVDIPTTSGAMIAIPDTSQKIGYSYVAKFDSLGLPRTVTLFGGGVTSPKAQGNGTAIRSIALGVHGSICISGWTSSMNIPYHALGYRPNHSGSDDNMFIATLDSNLQMPVELENLRAVVVGKGVELHWRTAGERNNYGFYVERSTDGSTWKSLGFVEGAGTTSLGASYQYIDELDITDPANAHLKYRLLQIDYDGTQEYSPIIEVDFAQAPLSPTLHAMYPQPVTGSASARFTLPEAVRIRLTLHDVTGREVRRIASGIAYEAGTWVLPLDVSGLPAGVYYLRLFGGEVAQVQKLVVM